MPSLLIQVIMTIDHLGLFFPFLNLLFPILSTHIYFSFSHSLPIYSSNFKTIILTL